jgi:hypothetical protein
MTISLFKPAAGASTWSQYLNVNFQRIIDYLGNAKGDAASIAARLDVELNADGSSKAKGSKASLTERLAVELNDDGTSKAKGNLASLNARISSVIDEDGALIGEATAGSWLAGQAATRTAADTFTVAGDYTGLYTEGRRVRFIGGAGGYGTVVDAEVVGEVTAVTVSGTVPEGLTQADVGPDEIAAPRRIDGDYDVTGTVTAGKLLALPSSAANASGATAISFAGADVQQLTLTGDASFSASNVDTTKCKVLLVYMAAGAAARTLTFAAGWVWLREKPTEIELPSGAAGVLMLTNIGSTIVAGFEELVDE